MQHATLIRSSSRGTGIGLHLASKPSRPPLPANVSQRADRGGGNSPPESRIESPWTSATASSAEAQIFDVPLLTGEAERMKEVEANERASGLRACQWGDQQRDGSKRSAGRRTLRALRDDRHRHGIIDSMLKKEVLLQAVVVGEANQDTGLILLPTFGLCMPWPVARPRLTPESPLFALRVKSFWVDDKKNYCALGGLGGKYRADLEDSADLPELRRRR